MNGFLGHIAGLRVRDIVGRSLRLLRACRAIAGRRAGQRCPQRLVAGEAALDAFRLLAGRLRRGAHDAVRRRFRPVLDSFVEVQRRNLGLTAGETRLLRRAWLLHVEGRDAREAVRDLLLLFRQRHRQETGGDRCPARENAAGFHESRWHSRLTALLLDEVSLATALPGPFVRRAALRPGLPRRSAATSPGRACRHHRGHDPPRPHSLLPAGSVQPGDSVSPGRSCATGVRAVAGPPHPGRGRSGCRGAGRSCSGPRGARRSARTSRPGSRWRYRWPIRAG